MSKIYKKKLEDVKKVKRFKRNKKEWGLLVKILCFRIKNCFFIDGTIALKFPVPCSNCIYFFFVLFFVLLFFFMLIQIINFE